MGLIHAQFLNPIFQMKYVVCSFLCLWCINHVVFFTLNTTKKNPWKKCVGIDLGRKKLRHLLASFFAYNFRDAHPGALEWSSCCWSWRLETRPFFSAKFFGEKNGGQLKNTGTVSVEMVDVWDRYCWWVPEIRDQLTSSGLVVEIPLFIGF